jgi:hypothetical protein
LLLNIDLIAKTRYVFMGRYVDLLLPPDCAMTSGGSRFAQWDVNVGSLFDQIGGGTVDYVIISSVLCTATEPAGIYAACVFYISVACCVGAGMCLRCICPLITAVT